MAHTLDQPLFQLVRGASSRLRVVVGVRASVGVRALRERRRRARGADVRARDGGVFVELRCVRIRAGRGEAAVAGEPDLGAVGGVVGHVAHLHQLGGDQL